MNRPASYIVLIGGFIWIIILAIPTQAQPSNSYIDSLKQQLILHPEPDSNYVLTVLRLASRLKFVDPEQAISYTQKGLDISQQLDNDKLNAMSYNMLGIAHAQQSNYAEAIPAFKQALEYSEKAKQARFLGQIHNNLGSVYKNLADYSTCLAEYLRAEQIYDSLDYSQGIAMVSNNLGNLYKRMRQPEKAVEHYKKARAEYRKQNNAEGYASAQLNLGIFYMEIIEDYVSAQPLLDSALQYYAQAQQTVREVLVLNALGGLYRRMENYDKALFYLEPALAKARTHGLLGSHFAILSNIARIESAKGDLEGAIHLAEQTRSIADSTKNIDQYTSAEFMLSEIYQEHGRWKEALTHYQNYKVWQDSIYSKQQTMLYQSLQVQREAYEREEQLKAQALQLSFLEEQISLENKWKWSLAAACLFLLFAGVLYYQKYRDRKQVASELETRNQLISKQKAEIEALDKAKSRFFTNISHEFRTPLNLILGPLRSNTAKIPPSELGMMQRNAESLLRLINQLLDLSKLETGLLEIHHKNTHLHKYLRDLTSAFHSQAKQKNIHYQIDIPDTEQLVQLDPEKLEQIVYNLLSNAFKFTPEDGKVSFHASLEKNHILRIAVSDTGLGIPEELQDKIFDRFYQVDGTSTRSFEGTGIGLSLTKELIEMQGGSIEIASQPGHGCRFIVLMPLKPYKEEAGPLYESESANQTELISALYPSSSIKPSDSELPLILVVEDHADLRHYLINQLKDEYHFLEAGNGEEGLALAIDKVPDIIITDVMMPRMDGVELIQRLKKDSRTSHIPVIMLTAKSDLPTRREGFETGADQYLTKPFDPPELQARLKSVLTQTHRLREKYSQAIYLKPREIEVKDHEAEFLQKLMDIIETHLDDSTFSVSQLQAEIGMSRMQLHRKLKALSGKSTSEFIRHFRLQRAADLLSHPGAQVADVAYRVGFSHLSYFAKAFKEQFGQVPSAFLK